jgi:beta-lactamase regulating signal transducer with metallopeptidase domain
VPLTITVADLHTIARFAATGMLNSLFAGIAIALLAWTVTRLSSRQGSNTRFAVWFSALIAIVLLPLVGNSQLNQSAAVPAVFHSAVTLPASLAFYLFAVWTIGATLGLLRVALSLYRLTRLRSSCRVVDVGQLDPMLRASLAAIQSRRRVTLLSSGKVRVPAAIGYFRPSVVFPDWALEEIPASELNAILLHELAHLRRWDDWTNLAQKIVKAVFFFHPAVWFIESRLSLEREMACDDAVLAAEFSPRAYAESLLGLAEKSFLRRGVHLAQAAVGQVRQLKLRLAEILRRDREKAGQGTSRVWKPAVAMITVLGIVFVYCLSRGPRLVAFSADAPHTASSFAGPDATSLQPEPGLQPVNLNFVESTHPSKIYVHQSSATRLRTKHRVAQKPSVVIAQRTLQNEFIGDEIATRAMVVLSNVAMERMSKATPAVLVVLQGEQFGMDGPVFWRLTVVHLTQLQQRILTGGVPKKI